MNGWDKYREYVDKHFRLVINGDSRTASVPVGWNEEGAAVRFLRVTMKTYEDDIKKSLKNHLIEKLKGVYAQIPDNRKDEP